MSGKRNFEWPQASDWDGFITQDKPGGVTQRVDPLTMKNHLKAAGFLTQNLNHVTMDTTPESVPTAVGTVSWNADEGTLDIRQPGGVTLQVGQEAQVHVTNRTGSPIGNGRVVYLTGAQGNRPAIALAEADSVSPSYAIAVTTQEIGNNAEGYATTQGLVRDLDTSGIPEGSPIYLSDTPGLYSATPSTTRTVRVGFVVRSHATVGSIFVAIQRVENLGDLGDVEDPTTGSDLELVRVGGVWKNIPGFINVKAYGAVGDGVTDDSTAIMAACAAARATAAVDPAGGDRILKKTVYFPAGTYLVTASEALLPSSYTTKGRGYRILGDGIGQTTVWFKPTTGSRVLMSNNNAFLSSDIRDITFKSNSNLNTFMLAYSSPPNGAVQRWSFTRVEWSGAWGKGFELYGSDNNSEYSWDDCGVGGEMGVFLYTPPGTSSDQHLNYWVNAMKFWPTAASPAENCFCELNRGGSVSIINSDFSGIQSGTLFKLKGPIHAYGVCHFTVTATRFELKSANALALYSEWPQGVILFQGCDFSSQRFVYPEATETFTLQDVNVPGASLVFEGCSLIGSFRFNSSSDCFRHKKHAVFTRCNFQQLDIYSAFLFTAAVNPGGARSVILEECRGAGSPTSLVASWSALTAYTLGTRRRIGGDVYEVTTPGTSGASAFSGKGSAIADGTVVWKWVNSEPSSYTTDGTHSWTGRVNPLGVTRRVASFRTAGGQLPANGTKVNVILPPGAIIVKAWIQSPPGGVTSGAPAAYTMQTEEGTPTVFAQGAASPASAGFLYSWDGFFPVGSDISKRSIVLVSGASVDQYNGSGIAFLEYIA